MIAFCKYFIHGVFLLRGMCGPERGSKGSQKEGVGGGGGVRGYLPARAFC